MNQIKQGYKQTKVGIIPEDWEIVKLESISDFITKGATPTTYGFNWQENGIPFLRSECVSDNGLNLKSAMYICQDAHNVMKRSAITSGDILMTITGNVGRVILLEDFQEGNINQHIARIRIIKEIANRNFIFSFLSQSTYQINYSKITTGQAYPQLSLVQVRDSFVAFPPLKEQEKIAEILTTWDEAITKQTELLRAKELQKKGLMQKLLSGEVRFNGFSDEWEEVRLGEICKITTGKLNANAMVENGEYTFFTCARDTYKIDEFAFDTEALLVSGNGANVGYIHYFNGKFNAYQRTYVLDGFKHNIFLIKYLLDKYLSLQISREKNEGNTPYITLPTLTKMKLKLPSLAEQQKIAEVLSLVDDEINLLKNELEELKLQKKALMQKLLTGEVRVKA